MASFREIDSSKEKAYGSYGMSSKGKSMRRHDNTIKNHSKEKSLKKAMPKYDSKADDKRIKERDEKIETKGKLDRYHGNKGMFR